MELSMTAGRTSVLRHTIRTVRTKLRTGYLPGIQLPVVLERLLYRFRYVYSLFLISPLTMIRCVAKTMLILSLQLRMFQARTQVGCGQLKMSRPTFAELNLVHRHRETRLRLTTRLLMKAFLQEMLSMKLQQQQHWPERFALRLSWYLS